MTTFQIVQMDPDAAKWIGFAKQQCNRIIDNGTQDFYREWPLGDATVKAKSYGGTVKLWLVAGGVTDYVGVAMPNPVPYRGVPSYAAALISQTGGQSFLQTFSLDIVSTSSGSDHTTQVMYFQNDVSGANTKYTWTNAISTYAGAYNQYSVMLADGVAVSPPPTNVQWVRYNGSANLTNNHYTSSNLVFDTFSPSFEELLALNDDAIYYDPAITYVDITTPHIRRKAWFLKNSTEFIAALKGKFQPGAAGVTRAELQTGSIPASWDYAVKTAIGRNYTSFRLADNSFAGRHTKMPIVMSITSAADVVVSDTSNNGAQNGTMVTKRTTTFAYTDADGMAWSVPIDGTLTQEITIHLLNGSYAAQSSKNTYSNWYDNSIYDILNRHAFWEDRTASAMGALWNGVYQSGYLAQSIQRIPVVPPANPLSYVGYTPPYPTYSNTLVGTAPDIFLQYHNAVLPQYVANIAQSSTVMNNSAMYHVKQVKLRLFAPAPGGVSVGIFADPTDADGATQIAYYGEATLSFDWTTGSIALSKWSPQQDVNGNDAPAIINLPTGYSYKNQSGTLYFNNGTTNYVQAYNCAIGYVWGSQGTMWPDVVEYWKAKNSQLKAGTFDQVLYTVMQGKQITPPP